MAKKKEEPQYLGVEEFASKVGYSSRYIRRLIQAGEISASRASERRKWQIPMSEVSRFRGKPQSIDERSPISKQDDLPTEQARQAHIDPVIMKQRKDHFADLADVAKRFINGLENVSRPGCTTNKPHREVYLIPNENSASAYDEMTKEQLSQQLNQNMKVITKDKDRFFRSCFVPHVKTGLPDEMKTKLFLQIVEEQPLELIECLKPLALGKSFKGVCPVCKFWYQPLTCPISCTTC